MKKTMYALLACAAVAFMASGALELWNKLNPPEDLFEGLRSAVWAAVPFLAGIVLLVLAAAVAFIRFCFARFRDKPAKHSAGILTEDGIPWLP